MTSREILNSYLEYYKQKGHKQIPNVSLVPQGDSTLLYVNSGMFPLVPYLSGEPHPLGKRLVNVQRALRFFEDLDNVGETNRHTTAFHMLGNWSFGDYFKKEQLPWAYGFFVEVLGLDPGKLFASVFEGDESAPRDSESIEIIKGVFAKYDTDAKEGERIFAYGKDDNWWQRGEAVGELGGPDSEVFYYIGDGDPLGKSPSENQDEFLEIGNSVFIQYKKTETGWQELPQKNVDFGGGLERIALAVQGKKDIFETDNFWPLILTIQKVSKKDYNTDLKTKKAMRVLADHMRAAVFLAMDGVVTGNKDQGYILRRLLRRMIRAGRQLGVQKDISVSLVPVVAEMFSWLYPDLKEKAAEIKDMFSEEEARFGKTLRAGTKAIEKSTELLKGYMEQGDSGVETLAKFGFDLYQSNGFPFELYVQELTDLGFNNVKELQRTFSDRFSAHQEKSRLGAERKFKGGLADQSEKVVKYHTVTHLLQAGLRKVLGKDVHQLGSNITGERLRFDFSYPYGLSDEEVKLVEKFVDEAVKGALPVNFSILPRGQAEKSGALFIRDEKYPDEVKVYFVGGSLEGAVSKEFCGGPHVKNTSELLPIEIYKQERIGEGKMRIYVKFR